MNIGRRGLGPSSLPVQHPREFPKSKVEALWDWDWDPRVAGADKAAGTKDGGREERKKENERKGTGS